ncbi:MAG: hypothetical protein P4L36_14315, partial [Holophaga sp.]|nr:hypothetical protein [Holophaga sp.]
AAPRPAAPAPPRPAHQSAPIPPPPPPVQAAPEARPALKPLQNPGDLESLRRACAEALKQAPGGLPRTLGALPHMATSLRFEGGILHWLFPPNVRNTVQDLEQAQANPHLLEALRQVLPGLTRLEITFDADNKPRPEDALRADPAFQRLLADTGGEIVDIRQVE